MTQNLYAPELNDRGWYRVNRENKKLKCEIMMWHKEVERLKALWVKDDMQIVRLRKALIYYKIHYDDGKIARKALKGGPK